MPGYLIAIIVISIIVLVFAIIFSLSAKIYISYDEDVSARIKFLFIDKAFDLDDVLRKLLKIQDKVETKVENMDNPPKTTNNEQEQPEVVIEQKPLETAVPKEDTDIPNETVNDVSNDQESKNLQNQSVPNEQPAKQKPNFLKQIYDKDGILGILLLVSTLLQSVNSAIITLIKGLHIRSLYVKMIIAGSDAAKVAMDYGKICGNYYALKGLIFSTMKVHKYDECIEPDFLAKYSEYAFNLELSISIGAVIKVGLVAAKTFLFDLIKNK